MAEESHKPKVIEKQLWKITYFVLFSLFKPQMGNLEKLYYFEVIFQDKNIHFQTQKILFFFDKSFQIIKNNLSKNKNEDKPQKIISATIIFCSYFLRICSVCGV